jgi:hypothetical protein
MIYNDCMHIIYILQQTWALQLESLYHHSCKLSLFYLFYKPNNSLLKTEKCSVVLYYLNTSCIWTNFFLFYLHKLWRTTFSRSRCTEYNMHRVEGDISLDVKRPECINHKQPTANSVHHGWYTGRYMTTCWTKKRDGEKSQDAMIW